MPVIDNKDTLLLIVPFEVHGIPHYRYRSSIRFVYSIGPGFLGPCDYLWSLPTVIRLGYQPDIFQNPSRILMGINGTQTTSLGEVVLPISVGLITMLVWLTVINELFSFNVILGHTWIHAIKALPSFYHQNLSFFDPLGTKDIRGDQKATTSCFIVEHPQTDQPTK